MQLTEQEVKNLLAHFPEELSRQALDYATNVAFLQSRYLFTRRSKARQQYAYCTHCKKTYKTENLKHNEKATCEKCHSVCVVKSDGMGRKFLSDYAYFVWYEKSLINPDAIVARGFYANRDYSGDYRKVETDFKVVAAYIFEPGKRNMFKYLWSGAWEQRKTVYSEVNGSMKHLHCYCSRESIIEAVKGTLFQYSTWEQYDAGDMVEFFDLAAKYPCIEYLTKIGLSNLVKGKLAGCKTFSAINWRGKTLDKVLKVSKAHLNEIRNSNLEVSFFSLYLFQQSKKDGSNITFSEAKQYSQLCHEHYVDELKKISEHATIKQIFRYVKKQFESKNPKKGHYITSNSVLIAWRDYLADCEKLDMDTTDESILFPTYLYRTHQNTIKKVKFKEDQALNIKITERVKLLDRYTFEKDGLLLRPVNSSQELIEEGNALKHCVGGYAKRYADGQTNLFVIRKSTNPDKPFYTLEVRDNRVTQAYGKNNCLPTKKVQAFIDTFGKKKLTKKASKEKVKIAQPA